MGGDKAEIQDFLYIFLKDILDFQFLALTGAQGEAMSCVRLCAYV